MGAWLVVVATLSPGQVPPGDRYLLMQSLQGTYYGSLLDAGRLQVTGWLSASATASTASDVNLPLGFNYRADALLANQQWLRVERQVVTSGTEKPTWGFRSDTLFGSDYRFTLARGVFDRQLTNENGAPQSYGIDPVQWYLEAYFPTVGRGLDIKAGRFFAIYGNEVIDAPGNALHSHAYTFIYNPFTHTGLLATLKVTDALTVSAAVVTGDDVAFDSAGEPTFTGNVKYTFNGGRTSVLAGAIFGSGEFDIEQGFNNLNIVDVLITHQINTRTTYAAEGLVGYQTGVPDLGNTTWQGLIQYLTVQLSPRWSATTRLEFFHDADGQRTGFKGLYTALTAGLKFQPNKHLTVRPELRYDHNDRSRPFEGDNDLFTAAADVILRW